MTRISLSNGGFATVDDEDVPLVSGRAWFSVKNKNSRYARTGRNIGMHALILGVAGTGKHVDHLNGDGLDNRRSNLRIVSIGDNLKNRQHKSSGESKFLGVARAGKKWCARITHDYKRVFLGTFDDEVSAFDAYQKARAGFGRPLVE